MTPDWKAIWERKADTKSQDHFEISGFEHFRQFDTAKGARDLCRLMDARPGQSILELGCGAGLLGHHLSTNHQYVGTDYSPAMVKKAIELNNFSALCCEANDLVFKDKSFDHVFAFSVFQYFPNLDYVNKVLSEMQRVARRSVCVSDIPTVSHEPSHMVYTEDFFAGWNITEPLYPREHRRFTATLIMASNS